MKKIIFQKLKFLLLFYILHFIFFPLDVSGQLNWYNDYDIKYYKIDIQVSDSDTYISGNTFISGEINKNPLDSFRFELNSMLIIDSITYNGQKLTYFRSADITSIPVGMLPGNRNFAVTIYYHGKSGNTGLHSSFTNKTDNSWNIPVTWTLSEPYGAKIWFPCKQDLQDKADSVAVFITVPKNLKAGSNGILTGITSVGNTHVKYEWKSKYPVAYYLISIAVADYTEYSYYVKLNGTDSVFFQNYVYNRPGFLESNKSQIDETANFLRLFSSKFGIYPFRDEKYGHCLAPLGGGMEHQTMTTLSNFGYNLVSHELAHQWFGDLVTCATWQDIWVNEGFASYGEYLAIDSLLNHTTAVDWMKAAHSLAFNYPTHSIFVPASSLANESRIFNYGITYKKGASIIHMLRYEINNDVLFFQILKKFLSDFSFRTATGMDFLNTVNSLTGADYTWFFDQWYFGKGHPEYDISWKQSNDTLYLTSFQTLTSPSANPFKMHFDVKLLFANGDTVIRLYQDAFNKLFTQRITGKINDIIINPEYTALMKVVNVNSVPDVPSIDDFVKVAPNPFTDYLQITFKSPPKEGQEIRLVSLNGSVMEIKKNSRRQEIKLDTRGCSSGIYLLYVRGKQKSYVRKVIKVR